MKFVAIERHDGSHSKTCLWSKKSFSAFSNHCLLLFMPLKRCHKNLDYLQIEQNHIFLYFITISKYIYCGKIYIAISLFSNIVQHSYPCLGWMSYGSNLIIIISYNRQKSVCFWWIPVAAPLWAIQTVDKYIVFLPVLVATPHNRGGQAQLLPDRPGLCGPHIQYLVFCEKSTNIKWNHNNMSRYSW